MSQSATAPLRVAGAINREAVLRLRVEGLTLTEIGDKVGLSPQRCGQIVKDELERLRERTQELTAWVRDKRLKEIAEYIEKLRPACLEGDAKAIETTLKLMDRESKFLGADAPATSKMEVKNSGNRYSEMSLEELRAEARRQGIPVVEDAEHT